MRFRFSVIAISALFAGAGFGQTERVLHFGPTDTPQTFREVNNVVRSIADIRDATFDEAARTMTLRATADQVAAGEWMFNQLEQRTGGQPAPPNSPMHEYRMASSPEVVRVHYLVHADTPQAIQEIVNAVRSTTDMQRMFPCNAARAIAMRASAEQVAMAEWALNELDTAASPSGEKPVMHEYRPAGSGDVVARVYFLAHTRTPQSVQEIVNLSRSMADVQRFFPVNRTNAVVMRGTVAQGALTEWLFNELDKSPTTQATAQTAAPHEYQYLGGGPGPGVVRVFYLANVSTPQAIQEITNQVRSAANVQRAFPYASLRALAVRGTAEQIGVAERLITERDAAGR